MESAGRSVQITKQYMKKQQIEINDYKEIDREIVSRIGRRASILEIGVNIGMLLNYFKRKGYSVCGIEPNVWCTNVARKKFGPNVYSSDLIAAKFNRESFDMVVIHSQYYRCTTGYRNIHIAPNGDVVPCWYFSKSVGNVKEKSIKEI